MLIIAIMQINNHPNCGDNADELLHELTGGDIASDLYGPQFWDDNFQFSFSVVVSCKSNKQLGYF